MLEIDVGIASQPTKTIRMTFVGLNGQSIGSTLEYVQNQAVLLIPPKYTDPHGSVIVYEFVFAEGAVSFVDGKGNQTAPVKVKKLRLLGSVWQNKLAGADGFIECTIIDAGSGKKLALLPLREGEVDEVLPGATEENDAGDGVSQWIVNYKIRLN